MQLLVLVERLARLLVGHRLPRLGVRGWSLWGLGFRRSARQADVEEGAGLALPVRGGEVPVGQRVGVRPVQGMVVGKLAEPFGGPFQGLPHPLRRHRLVVPDAAAGVHHGDHRVPQLPEGPQGVEACLGHRRRVAALRAQGAPPLERLRPPRLDLDDRLAAEQGHDARGVGVARHHQVGADLHRRLRRVLGVGGSHLPAGPLHGPQDDGFESVARLQDRQRLPGGRVGRLVARCRVPEGAAAGARRRCPYLELPVPVEPRRRAGVDVRLAVHRLRCHVLCSFFLWMRSGAAPVWRQPRRCALRPLSAPLRQPSLLRRPPPPLRSSGVASARGRRRRPTPLPGGRGARERTGRSRPRSGAPPPAPGRRRGPAAS